MIDYDAVALENGWFKLRRGWYHPRAEQYPGHVGFPVCYPTSQQLCERENLMTTTVKVHVNGRYRASVVQVDADGKRAEPFVVEGNYEGSPNPSGEHSFHLYHPAIAAFEITEEQVPEAPPAAEPSKA